MRKAMKFNVFLVIIVLITVGITGCIKKGPTQLDEESVKLRIGGSVLMASIVLEVARDRGFFSENNLDVEIERVSSSKVTMAGLESGDLDIIIASRSAGTFNHLLKNEELRIVADAQRITPIIVVRKDLQDSIAEIADLRGKIFATPRAGSTSQYVLVKALETAGLSLNDVISKSLEDQEAVAALEAGNIDAAIINEPFATLAINNGIGVRLAEEQLNQIFPQGQQHAVLLTSVSFLENRGAAEKFFRAYKKAAEYYLRAKQSSQPERNEVIRIVSEYTGVDPEIVNQVDWINISVDLKPDVEYMKQAQDWYFENGFLDEKVDFDKKLDLNFL